MSLPWNVIGHIGKHMNAPGAARLMQTSREARSRMGLVQSERKVALERDLRDAFRRSVRQARVAVAGLVTARKGDVVPGTPFKVFLKRTRQVGTHRKTTGLLFATFRVAHKVFVARLERTETTYSLHVKSDTGNVFYQLVGMLPGRTVWINSRLGETMRRAADAAFGAEGGPGRTIVHHSNFANVPNNDLGNMIHHGKKLRRWRKLQGADT